MIGIDLVKIERIEGMIARHGERALQRFLSPDEIALVGKPHTAAGFWAAKEACAKALGCGIGGECGFHDIVITKTGRGAPQLALSETVRERFGITDASLSITHDGGFAIAVVALEGKNSL
ncbi:holo-ACP synthase [Sulfurimonas sp. HSL-3221]|uniref:holo-ACP synthase n=1 Tax=Sulfurimonadaceae TaxID=2771471 RepID=UPI001E64270D|nr:holo-ACP synthase [Sulfurimonas sp. HSL-3221]UFS63268.1 holo-ACP synthase [Sulfurimonas sp. HSL-3221]